MVPVLNKLILSTLTWKVCLSKWCIWKLVAHFEIIAKKNSQRKVKKWTVVSQILEKIFFNFILLIFWFCWYLRIVIFEIGYIVCVAKLTYDLSPNQRPTHPVTLLGNVDNWNMERNLTLFKVNLLKNRCYQYGRWTKTRNLYNTNNWKYYSLSHINCEIMNKEWIWPTVQ